MGKRLQHVLLGLIIMVSTRYFMKRFIHWRRRILQLLTDGSRVVVTHSGPIETFIRGDGKPIMLIHGSPGGCDFWRVYQDLLRADYQIICPSRPGYLQTPVSSGRTIIEQARLMIDLLDSLEIDSVAIIGFSGGAPIAIQLAISYPERVTALVIESGVSMAIDITDTTEDWFLKASNATPYLQRPLYWVGHRLVRMMPGFTLWSTLWLTTSHTFRGVWSCMRYIVTHPVQLRLFWRLFDANLPYGKRQQGYNNDITMLGDLPDFAFEDIDCPTLFIHSRYDTDVAIEHAHLATTRILTAELMTIDGCGHFIWLGKQRQQVLAHRLRFLKMHHSSTG